MITSHANKSVKDVMQLVQKAKARKERGLFIVEGVKMFLEAPVERIEQVYISESFAKQMTDACQEKLALLSFSYEAVTDDIFRKMSDTKTPQGILCVLKQQHYRLEEMFIAPNPLLVLLEDIQDPGNLGTIFRSGEGAGITAVIGGTIEELRRKNITVYAAHLQGAKDYDMCDYRSGTAFLIGNEANGLRKETTEKADTAVKIPMMGKVESLNAAIATSVLLFEAARQRRK